MDCPHWESELSLVEVIDPNPNQLFCGLVKWFWGKFILDGTLQAASPSELNDTPDQPDTVTAGGFLFIGELAKETGVDPKTIRFYEREGLLSPPRHGKFRTYMEADVRRLKDVLAMRRMGIGIAQIRKLLETNTEITGNVSTISVLFNHLETLRGRQTEVAEQLNATAAVLRRYTSEENTPG